MITPSAEAPVSQDELRRFRLALGRLSRTRRQHGEDRLPFAQLSLLYTITEFGDAHPTVGDVAAVERLSRPSVTRSIDRLEELGLIERVGDDVDLRVVRLRLTEAGREEQRLAEKASDVSLAYQLERLDAGHVGLIVAALPALEQLVQQPLPAD